MNATIAKLHSFDPAAIGLGDYGRPAGFVERQVARWSKQYLADTDAGRLPQMDALVDKGRDLVESAADLIRERPLASFGVAFAAGWIIAKLARGGDK